jgi:hypothetical protein
MFAYRVAFSGGLNLSGNLFLQIGCGELTKIEQRVAEN